MSAPPLTHHDILGLVEPFTRRGRHVDLRATDRIARRLVFKTVEHPASGALPALRETLALEHPTPELFRLNRILDLGGGVASTLWTEGADQAELLARIDAIPLDRQVTAGPGYVIAGTYRLEAPAPDGVARTVMTDAAIRVDGYLVELRVPAVRSSPGDLDLSAVDGARLDLPQDLLAVLGWPWGRIVEREHAWRGVLRLPRREPARTREAEIRLQRTAEHLVRTLGESPARFHERFTRARWNVTLRRAVPLAVCIGLFILTFAVRDLEFADNASVSRMLFFHAPPLLLALFFMLPEMPRIEIPPLPRRLRADAWRKPEPSSQDAR